MRLSCDMIGAILTFSHFHAKIALYFSEGGIKDAFSVISL